MASGVISNDPDESAAVANAYRQYADQIEQYGAVDPSVVAQLNTLGDIYAEYKDAKQQELTERAGAHSRVANQARLLAAKLEATAQAFIEQDANSAASARSVTE
jgi:Excreted virulence factor EspC, type VII ESX diderm